MPEAKSVSSSGSTSRDERNQIMHRCCLRTEFNRTTIPSILPMVRSISVFLLVAVFAAISAPAQDWIKTGTGLGVERIRIAVPDFKASSQDPRNGELLRGFNDTLWNDLDNAGIFDMVSKSFYPLGSIGAPADVKFESWSV